jgi:hypothetical protein
MPGEPDMETYLGRMFDRGAVMVSVFSWDIGGEAMRNNFFRRATTRSLTNFFSLMSKKI